MSEKDLSHRPLYIGNIYNNHYEGGQTGLAGATWNVNGVSPTLTHMDGGGRQPMILVKEDDYE